jgi:hypothetical protein
MEMERRQKDGEMGDGAKWRDGHLEIRMGDWWAWKAGLAGAGDPR